MFYQNTTNSHTDCGIISQSQYENDEENGNILLNDQSNNEIKKH